MAEVLANLATTTLNANLTAGGLSATVGTDGPFPSTGDFRIRIGNELIIVTDVSGSNVLGGLQRGAEGTTAAAHSTGDAVRHVLTRDSVAQLILEGAGASDPQLATLAAMDDTHATTLRDATAWGLALLLDNNAGETKSALTLDQVNNTADSAKPVSAAQDTAIKTITRSSIAVAAYDVATTDIHKTLDMTFSGAQTITLKPAASGGPTLPSGQWFQVRKTNTTGVKTLAWTGAVIVRDPATGTQITAGSTTLNNFETLRIASVGTDVYVLEWRQPAASNPDIAVLKEAPLLPEYYGANQDPAIVADNSAAIQAALDDANNKGGTVYTKPGLGYQVKGGTQVKVGDRTALELGSDIYVDPANSSTLAQVILVEKTGNQVNGAKIIGRGGRIRCNRKATDAIVGNTMRGCRFRDFEIMDPLQAGFRVKNTHASLDADSCSFHNLYLRSDSLAAFPAADRPYYMFVFDGTGARIVSDMLVDNCQVVAGLHDETPGNQDGGWGLDIIDGQRIKVRDFMVSDNNRRYSGGVRIRTSATSVRNSEGNVIQRLYIEAAATTVGFGSWIHSAIQLAAASGSSNAVIWTEISALRANYFGIDGHGRRLHLTNPGFATGGSVTDNWYLAPRNTLNAAGQIILAANTSNNLVQVGRDTEQGFVTNSGATSNRIYKLTGPGASGSTAPGYV